VLYLITNRKLALNNNFYDIIDEAISGGIYAIILREKDLPYDELLSIALKIKKIIGSRNVKLIINSNLEVANAMEAYGFHTNFENFIKSKPSFNGVLGVSVHTLEEAVEAEKHGADYLLLGHIFETECKKGLPPKGIELIKTVKNQVNIPIIALGGIKPENTQQIIGAGADGVAVMSTIMQCKTPYTLTRNYIDKMTTLAE
jgi:thiamine-phosphate diphosphorylase